MKVQWLLPMLALPLLTVAACHPAAPPPPVDDTARDAAPQPDPAPSPKAAAKPAIPAKLHATGTEPFWGAIVDGAVLTYSTPEFPNGIRITVSRAEKPGSAVFTGALDGKPLTLTVAPGTCSDGMSDKVYSFTALREIGPDSARGCADPQ
ncbi:COG3650 family protein [Novosphingobium cyanobacteriorum]|uniref:Lipoprotein n=1 Tax=Novosphingobium cyanobacteriorum TaxID=3024215 RepID=A0ABT6CHY3_9SPHN|nr:hypothetical protein [Novosphingobium cyanobacteriorum]MDF8331952.1 hypothetical protein [Novosphingobium cyanobacteriorum]